MKSARNQRAENEPSLNEANSGSGEAPSVGKYLATSGCGFDLDFYGAHYMPVASGRASLMIVLIVPNKKKKHKVTQAPLMKFNHLLKLEIDQIEKKFRIFFHEYMYKFIFEFSLLWVHKKM